MFAMSLSTFCVLSVVLLSYTERTVGLKNCQDCMPYTRCEQANLLATTGNYETEILFNKAYCGLHRHSIIKICCSEFGVPNVLGRWNGEPDHPNIRLLPEVCGTIAIDRIHGGTEARLYEFPWMVVIAYGDKVTFGCSGTLINSRYVLTAAHCVLSQDIKGVRIGDYNLLEDVDCQGGVCEHIIQDREIEESIVHREYCWSTFKNDIALIRLKVPVTMPLKNANAICLPTTSEIQKEFIKTKQATVAGWGLTENGTHSKILRKVTIPINHRHLCESIYGNIFGTERFCAGELGKDSCKGDSGGPLMMETSMDGQSRFVQYGIVSSGPEQCGTAYPGIYTDVRKYMKWILDNIEE